MKKKTCFHKKKWSGKLYKFNMWKSKQLEHFCALTDHKLFLILFEI